jgi:hypothetical protein
MFDYVKTIDWKKFIVPGVVAATILTLGGLRYYQSLPQKAAPHSEAEATRIEREYAPKPKKPAAKKQAKKAAPTPQPQRETRWCYVQRMEMFRVWWEAYEC